MSGETSLTTQVRLTTGDLYRYSLSTILRRFRFFVALFVVLAMYLGFQFSSHAFEWNLSFESMFGPIFFFVVFPYAFFIAPYFSSKKYLRQNPNVAGPNTYTFSADGIEIVGAQSSSRSNWEAIQEARETSTLFLLYPQTAIAHVIPKRFLQDLQQQSELRNLIRAHVKKFKLRG